MQSRENRDNRGHPDRLRWAALYARIALGAAFPSGIADRFGLYRGRNVGYGDFAGFVRYTGASKLLHAAFHDPISSVGRHDSGAFLRHYSDLRDLQCVGRPRKRSVVDCVWDRHGDCVRYQIAARLLGLLGIFGCAARCCVRESTQGVKPLVGSAFFAAVLRTANRV
jgi:hypothetical protein